MKCEVRKTKSYPCGHEHILACSTPIEEQPCDFYCRAPLACGHLCRGKCADCWSTRIHKPCDYHITQSHYCGEIINMKCVGLSDCHALTPDSPVMMKVIHWCTNQSLIVVLLSITSAWSDAGGSVHTTGAPCHCNRPPCDNRCPEVMECGHQCNWLVWRPLYYHLPRVWHWSIQKPLNCHVDTSSQWKT